MGAAYDREHESEGGWSESGVRSSCIPTLPCIAREPSDETVDEEAPPRIEDAPPSSLPWCVDRGAELQAMSTLDLWHALENGVIPPESKVWREGMECWTPAHDVRELRWTLSERAPEVAEGGGAPVSVALTPAELVAVTPWGKGGGPAPERPPTSTREERAEMATMPSVTSSRRARAMPISLELPASFPEAPCDSVGQELAVPADAPRTALAVTHLPQEHHHPTPAPQTGGAVSSGVRGVAGRLLPRRADALYVAAGCAVATLAIGAAALGGPGPGPGPGSGRMAIEGRVGDHVPRPAVTERAPVRLSRAGGGVTEATPRLAPLTASATPRLAPQGERGQHRLRRGVAASAKLRESR